jgi:NADH dehydrogenase (ubiquinone) 1 beta subcomplex subunit 7
MFVGKGPVSLASLHFASLTRYCLSSGLSPLQEEMDAAKLPWAWRDYCAHLLIPLNKCRRMHAYMPWECHHEKHVYEKCQYKVGAAASYEAQYCAGCRDNNKP